MKINYYIFFILNLLLLPIFPAMADDLRGIFFPTEKSASFIDTFGAPRGGGRTHEGIDIMGKQMMPLYSAIDGVVKNVVLPEAWYGYALTLLDADGYEYHYLHINNDSPGTNDGLGGSENAYAPGIVKGAEVKKGDLVGWMGNSGNAEQAGHHLHFEIRRPGDGAAVNPYESLLKALAASDEDVELISASGYNPLGYCPKTASDSSPDINIDKNLTINSESACASSSLVKLADSQAVYYCGADGKRYVFPNDKIYFTWYADFDSVMTISSEEMAKLPLGGNATYKPGVKMLKIQTDPKVYAVDKNGTLRWIRSAETAARLYGAEWKKQVDDLPDSFFFDYGIGEEI
jgi:hypothetical protein